MILCGPLWWRGLGTGAVDLWSLLLLESIEVCVEGGPTVGAVDSSKGVVQLPLGQTELGAVVDRGVAKRAGGDSG